jgi:S-DNA-T family DNA segregation ATPase FtsK/SpoIIIE
VVLSHESAKVEGLFKMLRSELTRRKTVLSRAGADFQSYPGVSGRSMPSILVIVHNYAAFTETYEDYEEQLASLTREGTKYGIYFLLTSSGTTSVRYRVLQNFSQLIVLQLNDSTEYSAVLGRTNGMLPSPLPGRGLFKSGSVYEFQTCRVTATPESEAEFIRRRCRDFDQAWEGERAQRIPVLPENATPGYLSTSIRSAPDGTLPIGVRTSDLRPALVDLTSSLLTLVLSARDSHVPVIQGLAEAAAMQGYPVSVLDPGGAFVPDNGRQYSYHSEPEDLRSAVRELFAEMVKRNHVWAEARDAGQSPPVFERSMCIVCSLGSLLSSVGEEEREQLSALLLKCDETLGVSVVVGDQALNVASRLHEEWVQKRMQAGRGLWVGDGIADQYVLQPSGAGSDLYASIGERFGWWLEGGIPTKVKVLISGQWQPSDEGSSQ